MSLKELQLPSIASLRAIAALRSHHLALVRPARIGLGFELVSSNQKSLADVEDALGGPGRISLPYSLRWLLDVITGLGVLHRTLGFVHGEVQPEHVLLGEDGVGRLVPVVRAHWVRGEVRAPERLYYLAPEKLLGDKVDMRSDVFSVGVMLWEALAGQRLLEAYEVDDIIARLMGGGIPRAQALEAEAWSTPLSSIAERAIAVDPARRFASIAELKSEIEHACSRYLASPPGMAKLFQDPARLARNHVRDSVAPESQRATRPPQNAPSAAEPTRDLPPYSARLDAAAERLSRSSFASVDFEDETMVQRLTTGSEEKTVVGPGPSAFEDDTVVRPQPAPLLLGIRPRHVQTLLGTPAPSIERDSSPDSVTTPFARIAPSSPVIITPLPVRTSAPAVLAPLVAAPTPASLPITPPAPVSLSPLAFAPARAPLILNEPSFELMRPRKRRGGLWLVLGAAVAAGLFAARPWLSQQIAAAAGGFSNDRAANVDAPSMALPAPAPKSPPREAPEPSSAPHVIAIASTPPAPSSQASGARRRAAAPEEHLVIHDSVEPSVTEPPKPIPAAPPAPVAAPSPAPTPAPAPAPPAPKAKPVPVSDADRYGI